MRRIVPQLVLLLLGLFVLGVLVGTGVFTSSDYQADHFANASRDAACKWDIARQHAWIGPSFVLVSSWGDKMLANDRRYAGS